jgi:D-amino-acid dehydrogenase
MRIAVIGAGIVGLATARRLVDEGHEVSLIDRAAGPGEGTSARNGAQLSYAYVAPLAAPGLPWQVPGMLLDRSSPLRLKPTLDPQLWRWGFDFLRACNQAQVEHATAALLALGERSRIAMSAWLALQNPARLAHRRNGKLVVYRDQAGLDGACAQRDLQARLGGSPQESLDRAACLAREPALARLGGVIAGGIWTPDEEVADCAAVCRALDVGLRAHPRCQVFYGADDLQWHCEGRDVRALSVLHTGARKRIALDAAVVAAGTGSNAVLRALKLRLPIAPLKGYSIEVGADDLAHFPIVSITDAARKIVFAPLVDEHGARLRVAGMAELVGDDLRIDPARIAQLERAVDESFGLRRQPADLQPWAGLRPATPTGLPCIGRTARWRNVYVNAGHGALGFTLAFGSAAQLADAIAHRKGELDAGPYSVAPLAVAG